MSRLAVLCPLAFAAASALAKGQDTVRISVDSKGAEGDDTSVSGRHSVAFDGKEMLIVFSSLATDLVASDKNGKQDIFLRDVTAGTTERIVLDVKGGEPDDDSSNPHITPDGRFVVFQSDATNLVNGDQNGKTDVFVLDRHSGTIERVSVDDKGGESDGRSSDGCISADGRYVVFTNDSDDFTGGDTNRSADVFLRDLAKGTTTCLSRNLSGATGDGSSRSPDISADGSTVAFSSRASDLVANDSNRTEDVFVYDLASGVVTRASVNEGGFELDDSSESPALSAEGDLITFVSAARNMNRDSSAGKFQVYVRDLATGQVWLASRALDGSAADGHCTNPILFDHDDGKGSRPYVAFWSFSTNLPGAGVADADAYACDFKAGFVQCVSVDSDGIDHASGGNDPPLAATADGDAIVFSCLDSQLVSGDGNGKIDVFMRGVQWTRLTEFGDGLAGSDGFVPHLTGHGGSCEADDWQIAIEDGLGRAAGHLWVGLGSTSGIKLFGGTFYVDFTQPIFPVPIQLKGFAGVGGSGGLAFDGVNVENLGQFSIYLQCTLLDPRAPRGISMSNALELAIDG
jgi:Tol biopolymer transport system component